MAVPTGTVCLTNLRTEFGDANGGNVCLTEYYAGGSNVSSGITNGSGTAIPSSGTLCLKSNFAGASNIVMGSFPSLTQGYANDSGMTGSLSNTGFGFRKEHINTAFGQQAGAFAVIGARHTPANGYITLEFYSGTNAALATVYYQKLTYTGLSGATWSMKYEYPNTSSAITVFERYGTSETTYDEAKHPATSNGGGYNEGTYYTIPTSGGFRQFPWICTANYRGEPFTDNAQARLGFFSDQVQITLKATLNGVDYTAASSTYTIDINAQRLASYIP